MPLSFNFAETTAFSLGTVAPSLPSEPSSRPLDRSAIDLRIAGVLAGAGAGLDVDRVLLYTIDDRTTRLDVTAQWSAYETEPVDTPRPLAMASADVAALSGSAVVLSDETAVSEWPVPVWCSAAVCVPVASGTTIHGTLWLTTRDAREFTDAELGLIEIVAGRLALELETRSTIHPPTVKPHAAHTRRASVGERPATSSLALLPSPRAPMLDELELAGWRLDRAGCASFYDWLCLADGRLLLACGSGHIGADMAWLQAARIALRAHALASRDAGELLSQASGTLWTASPGGQGLALGVALLDTSNGGGTLALAGNAVALRWRASSCQVITSDASPAGWHQRAAFVPRECNLLVRERLILATTGNAPSRLDRLTDQLLAQSSDAQRRMHARGALGMVLESASDKGCDLRSLALVRRR